MAKKFLVNLDLSKNQILNASIQNLTSPPSSPVSGQIYYNTIEKSMYFYDGISWVNMSGDIQDVVGGAGLTAITSTVGGIVTLNVNVDNQSLQILSDTLRIKDGGVDFYKLANVSQDLNISATPTQIASAQAVKQYVDGVVGGIGNLEGDWDVSLYNSFPHVDSPAVIKKGDYWVATSVGTIYGTSETIKIEVGDVFIAKVDNAGMSDNTQWIVLQVNRDQATESELGLVRIADQTTVNTGTDDTEVITPLKLKTYLNANVGGYAADFGSTSSTNYNIVHNLGTMDISVTVYEYITPVMLEEVFVDFSIQDNNSIDISLATAPITNNKYRVVIKK